MTLRTRTTALLRSGTATRTAWGLSDQVLSSLSNFALGLLVVRSATLRDFGTYSLLFSAYLLLMGSVRAIYVQPFTVRPNDDEPALKRSDAAAVLGGGLTTALVASVVMVLLSTVVSSGTGVQLLAFGFALPGLLLQDTYRLIFFAMQKPRAAAANDMVWTVVQFTAAAVVIAMGASSVSTLVLCWGGGALIAACYGYAQCAIAPAPMRSWPFLRANLDIGLPFFGEYWTNYGVSELTVYGLGFATSLTTVGMFKGGLLLMGPLNLLNNALALVALPEMSRLRHRSVLYVRRASITLTVILATAAVALASVLLLCPDPVGRAIVGESWADLQTIILPIAFLRGATALTVGPLTGCQALEAATRTLKIRLASAPAVFGATLLGGRLFDASGAAIGMGVVFCIASIYWWRQYLKAEDDYLGGVGMRATAA